jgi:virginiamycin B lyase
MQNRCQRVLLTMIVLLCAVGGLAGRALALTFAEFPIPSASSPFTITAGPDGALWFTEANVNKIGRITAAGAVTEFSLPTNVPGFFGNGNNGPFGITAGPDGALWFAEFATNQIGRITADGVVTQFPLPTAGTFPQRITAGPDGVLWFATGFVGRITTAGVITVFPVPLSVTDITAGPDGALWFVEYNNGKLGRITTAGVITEFVIPTAGSAPSALITPARHHAMNRRSCCSGAGFIRPPPDACSTGRAVTS